MKKRFLALLLTLTMVLSMGAIMVSANTETNPEGAPPAGETLPTLVAYHGSITVDGSTLTGIQITSRKNEIDANAHVPLGDDVYLGLAWGTERLSAEDKDDEDKVAAAKSYFYVHVYSYAQNLSKVELKLGDEELSLTRGETATLPEGVQAAFGKAECNIGDAVTDAGLEWEVDWQEFDSSFELAFPLEKLDFVIGDTDVTLPFEIKVTTDKAAVEKKANVRLSSVEPFYTFTMAGRQSDDFTEGGSWTNGNDPTINTYRTFLHNGWRLQQMWHKDLTANKSLCIGCNSRQNAIWSDNYFVKMQLTVAALPEGRPQTAWIAQGKDLNPARIRICLGHGGGTGGAKWATVLDLYNGGEDGLFLYRDVGDPIISGEPLNEAATMSIGKKVGDTFDLSLHMQADHSLDVWVDNELIGTFPAMDEAIFTSIASKMGRSGNCGYYFEIIAGTNMATGATPNDHAIDVTIINTVEGIGAPLDLNALISVLDGTYANYETAIDPPDEDEDEDDGDQVTAAPSKPNKPAVSTTAPAETEAPTAENSTQEPSDTEKKKGCGSSLAGGALALVATLGLAGVMLKKKH